MGSLVFGRIIDKVDLGNDEELDRMLSGVTISHGGVMPRIEPELLPKKIAIKSHSTDTSMMASQEY
ncbi:histone H2AX protein [Danaus plexippus plexippus]|uniref:Histone H2AX protein n=1 Tax=Danaus plexippus plexippus TaxID=278856 RepID=A0A212FK27_DANPL|nr:histone H2AX protein [Danaus plexippus plexippus]